MSTSANKPATAAKPTTATVSAPATKAVATTTPAPALKKGPSPVFSIPATAEDKTYIGLQSDRTGMTQKELLTMAIASAKKQIEALPKYVAPEPVVKVKAKKASEAEATLASAGK